MEPLVLSGSYCLLRFFVPGSRSGRTVLVEERKIAECAYTLKRYRRIPHRETSPVRAGGSSWNRFTQISPKSRWRRTPKAKTNATPSSPNSCRF
jgi:hypothetical protein